MQRYTLRLLMERVLISHYARGGTLLLALIASRLAESRVFLQRADLR